MDYFDNTRPIYIQIFEKFRKDIVSGLLRPGQKLKSVREYAEEFIVNPNTMQKSMTELQRAGLVYTKRNAGKYVTEDVKKIEITRDELSKDTSLEYLKFMKQMGYSKYGILKYLENLD